LHGAGRGSRTHENATRRDPPRRSWRRLATRSPRQSHAIYLSHIAGAAVGQSRGAGAPRGPHTYSSPRTFGRAPPPTPDGGCRRTLQLYQYVFCERPHAFILTALADDLAILALHSCKEPTAQLRATGSTISATTSSWSRSHAVGPQRVLRPRSSWRRTRVSPTTRLRISGTRRTRSSEQEHSSASPREVPSVPTTSRTYHDR